MAIPGAVNRIRRERLAHALQEKQRRDVEANRLPWERPMDERNWFHPRHYSNRQRHDLDPSDINTGAQRSPVFNRAGEPITLARNSPIDDLRTAAGMLLDTAERMRGDRIPMPLEHYAAHLEANGRAVLEAIKRYGA